jgi:hypothetical protein
MVKGRWYAASGDLSQAEPRPYPRRSPEAGSMKGIPQFLKPDPVAARKKAQAELSAAKSRLAALGEQRSDALARSAEILAIRTIDREAEEIQATIVLIEDRLVRLNKALRQAERLRLEQQRDQAIKSVVEPQFAEIERHALKLETAIDNLAEAFSALEQATRELNTTWPRQTVPLPKFWDGTFSILDLSRRIESAFQYSSSQAIHRLREFVNLQRSETLSEAVAHQIRDRLVELRAVEIELPEIEDSDDDPPSASAPVAPRPHRPIGLSEGLVT